MQLSYDYFLCPYLHRPTKTNYPFLSLKQENKTPLRALSLSAPALPHVQQHAPAREAPAGSPLVEAFLFDFVASVDFDDDDTAAARRQSLCVTARRTRRRCGRGVARRPYGPR